MFTNYLTDMCLFSFHSLFLFSVFSTSIGTTKNTEQTSDTVTIVASVLGVLFIAMILPALIMVGILCYR